MVGSGLPVHPAISSSGLVLRSLKPEAHKKKKKEVLETLKWLCFKSGSLTIHKTQPECS